MASNKMDGGKCKGGSDVKARLRHNDCTPSMRTIAARGNEHIDPAKSHLNVNLTGNTYAERCARYDSRIAALDAQPKANKRRDRVTGQLIETPVPEGLPREQYNAFLTRVLEIEKAMFGAENLISADIHWDEEHEYIDADTHEKTMSRVHLHSLFVPIRDGKLYGQAIYNRKNLYALNNAVQKMAVDEFGVDFLTGEGKSSKKTVGQLKAQSEAAAIVEAARVQGAIDLDDADTLAEQVRQEAQQEADSIKADAEATRKAAEAILSEAKAQAGEILSEAEKARQEAAEARREAQAIKAQQEAESVAILSAAKAAADEIKAAAQAKVTAAVRRCTSDNYQAFMRAKVPGYDALMTEFTKAAYSELRQAPEQPTKSHKRTGKVQQPAHQSEAAAPRQQPPKPPQLDAAAQARIAQTLAELGYQASPAAQDERQR